MIYVDSNVFINAAINDSDAGKSSRKLLTQLIKGQNEAMTSVLTIDEVLWALQKEKGKAFAAEVTKTLLCMRNLSFVDATRSIVENAIEIYGSEKLNPRDSTHVATMFAKGLTEIASFDQDFDAIKEIKRVTP